MVKWKQGQKDFSASPRYDERHGCTIVIPKLVVELLSSPKKFVIKINRQRVNLTGDNKK